MIGGDAVRDDAKTVLINVVNAVTAVRDFLAKLAAILGIPVDVGVVSLSVNLSSKLDSLTDKLNDVTGAL